MSTAALLRVNISFKDLKKVITAACHVFSQSRNTKAINNM